MSSNLDRFIQRVHDDCVNAKRVTAADEAESNDAMAWRFTEKAEDCVNAKPATSCLMGDPDCRDGRHEQCREDGDLLDAIRRLAPFLNRYCDLGWPGLSERDRGEANNARVDLLNAAEAIGAEMVLAARPGRTSRRCEVNEHAVADKPCHVCGGDHTSPKDKAFAHLLAVAKKLADLSDFWLCHSVEHEHAQLLEAITAVEALR